MTQMMLADAEYAGKSQQTHKELFLIEMDQVPDPKEQQFDAPYGAP